MFKVYMNILKENKSDENVLKDKKQLALCRKRLTMFTVESTALSYDGNKVPIEQQLEHLLQPVHHKIKGHNRDAATLKKAVSEQNSVMPKFTGGLETVCRMLGLSKKSICRMYLYRCPVCLWTFHEADGWERATKVPEELRKQNFSKAGFIFVRGSNCSKGNGLVGPKNPRTLNANQDLLRLANSVVCPPFFVCHLVDGKNKDF